MFLVNSRLGLFVATFNGFGGELLHRQRHPFSRSYGVILPSSLARVLSIALESSSHLPASVCGTGTCALPRGFSRKHGISHFASQREAPHQLSGLTLRRIFQSELPTTLAGHIRSSGWPTLLRPPIGITNARWYWNVRQLSIAYAFRPRLRPD